MLIAPRKTGGILITGGTGYLGRELVRQARLLPLDVSATYYSQQPPLDGSVTWLPLDVADPLQVEEAVDQLRPKLIIHTAYQQHGPELWAVTAEGARNVAQAAEALGSRLVHLSSDVIFDGEKEGAYTEDDPPAPISPYGAAKGAAEAFVAAACPHAAIVRTSLTYGLAPLDVHTRFVLSVADGERDAALFSDEYRCPVFVEDLAAALLELTQGSYAGVLHIAGSQQLSRYQFGRLLAAAHGRDPALLLMGLSTSSGLPRPRNCVLNIDRARSLLHTPLRGVEEVLGSKGI